MVGDNFGQFRTDIFRVCRLATDTGEHLSSLLKPALLDEVAGRFGQHKQTTSQNDGPQHLESNWDAIGAGVIAILGSIINACRCHQTDCDAELVSRDNSSTDLARRDLRHVQDDDGRDETNPKACNQTTGHDQAKSGGCSLEDDTDNEDTAATDDGGAAAKPICKITSNKGTEEGSRRENGGNQRLLPRWNDEIFGGGCSRILCVVSDEFRWKR